MKQGKICSNIFQEYDDKMPQTGLFTTCSLLIARGLISQDQLEIWSLDGNCLPQPLHGLFFMYIDSWYLSMASNFSSYKGTIHTGLEYVTATAFRL